MYSTSLILKVTSVSLLGSKAFSKVTVSLVPSDKVTFKVLASTTSILSTFGVASTFSTVRENTTAKSWRVIGAFGFKFVLPFASEPLITPFATAISR